MPAAGTDNPRFDRQLRRDAVAAYRATGSYRKAAKRLGRSLKRTRDLTVEGLQLEMEDALLKDARREEVK